MNKSWIKLYTLIIFSLAIFINSILPQCLPWWSDTCEDASVLCSLTELDGYTCQNVDYSNPTGCSPLCPSGGGAHNTSWWAFVSDGSELCITLTYNNCSVNNTGLQIGVWGDCECLDSIQCDPSCNGPGIKSFCMKLMPCKVYYLFIDGCTGDICDYLINTTIGNRPKAPKIKNIQGPLKICTKACNVTYNAEIDNPTCMSAWFWTLDGDTLIGNNSNILLDFQKIKSYVLCANAIIGNPMESSWCDQSGPKCITIEVQDSFKLNQVFKKLLCSDQIPFQWGDSIITKAGIYKQRFIDKCCTVDSTIEFFVENNSILPNYYFLGCQGENFIEPFSNRKIDTCQDGNIFRKKGAINSSCDSSHLVFASFINYSTDFKEYCKNEKLILEVNPIDKSCFATGTSVDNISISWYKKNEPSKIIAEGLSIEIQEKSDYCAEIKITSKIQNINKVCSFNYCESINENNIYNQEICFLGQFSTCYNTKKKYKLENPSAKDVIRLWKVKGGKILTFSSEKADEIEILWDTIPMPLTEIIGSVCYQQISDCPITKLCCKEVKIYNPAYAGIDKKVNGSLTTLYAYFSPPIGKWTKISGPGEVLFSTPNTPMCDVRVNMFGSYIFRWTVKCDSIEHFDDINVKFSVKKADVPIIVSKDTINQDSLGTRYNSRSFITILPNPVESDEIFLKGGIVNSEDIVIISDLNGKIFLQKKIFWNEPILSINLSSELKPGIYIIRMTGDKHREIVKKLIRL